MSRNEPSVFGTLLPPSFLVAHHFFSGDVHQSAAQECAAIAATHLNGLEGKTTIHPGAGFGADMWTVQMHGASKTIGLEKCPEIISIGNTIIRRPHFAAASISQQRLIQELYTHYQVRRQPTKQSADIKAILSNKMKYMMNCIAWCHGLHELAASPDDLIDIRQCDLTQSNEVSKALDDHQGDAAIANFVLHTLVSANISTTDALELMAPLVKPGGLLILSLPSQVIEAIGEKRNHKIQQCSIFNHPEFRSLSMNLEHALPAQDNPESQDPTSTPTRPQLIKESDIKAGSPSFAHLTSHIRAFMSPKDTTPEVIAGLLLFQAVFSRHRPAEEMVPFVRSVLCEKTITPCNGVGIHIQFHVLRRR